MHSLFSSPAWMVLAGAGLTVAATPALAAALYLGGLGLLARRTPSRPTRVPRTRFDVLVPAHDEAEGIAATLTSLRTVDYPRALYRVIVVADNCRDATSARARCAGAVVVVREDEDHQGKGYALACGYEASLADGFADAVVVVDADSVVSPNLLRVFDAALGAGHEVLQADYGVRNPGASRSTRLVTLGFALFHGVRSTARERLGLSCGLRGNGMCFTADVLRRIPHRSFSLAEDVEYGLELGLAGVRVAYVAEARVLGDMPTGRQARRSQRERWEGGRQALVRRYAGSLLRAAAAKRDPIALDLALDLLVPPLSRLATVVLGGWLLAMLATVNGVPAEAAVAFWSLAAVGLGTYLVRGCAATGDGWGAVATLASAPVYMVWRLTLRTSRSYTQQLPWVRTSRLASRGE